MISIRETILLIEAAQKAAFILDPALDPTNYQITPSLKDVEKWKARTYSANNGGKVGDMGNVGYIMISQTSNRIIPISRNDEHHRGFDTLHDLNNKILKKKKSTINIRDYVPIFFSGYEYIDSKNEVPILLNVVEKFLSYGGRNGLLEGAHDMRGKAMTLQQFVDAKGNMTVKKGIVAPVGAAIITSLEKVAETSLVALNSQKRSDLAIAGKAALDAIKTIDFLGFLAFDYFKGDTMKQWTGMVRDCIKDNNPQALRDMFFGFPSIKNEMHTNLKKIASDPEDYNYDKAVAIWGDLKLAINILSDIF